MKQSKKSQETKSRIFKAAKQILQEQGYEALSIKRICEVAEVSNGSFYHHFISKDDLLSYYIEELPKIELRSEAVTKKQVIDQILSIYLNYVLYCTELGVFFVGAYYNPKNQALNHKERPERNYPIIIVSKLLKNAIDREVVFITEPMESILTDIRMLVIGNVFEWCVSNGEAPFSNNMERSLSTYLSAVLFDSRK